MNLVFLMELLHFSFSREGISKKVKFVFVSFLFYRQLAGIFSGITNEDISETSHSGDDIYPLF